ncbi:MAG: class I SAM-dependent methyltransferase, partial [Patescibacteria group bacterium]
MSNAQKITAEILAGADVCINGDRPWDLQVKNDKFYNRVLSGGSLALGESYLDGWWEVAKLDQFFAKVLAVGLDKKVRPSFALGAAWLKTKLLNPQRRAKAFEIGERHYDIGNDLYQAMLDGRMTYTCGYWKDLERIPANLDAAQEAKLDLVCKKIGLKAGDKVLDIGCGWGSFAKFAAEKYGATIVGVTVSKQQAELAKQLCAGWPIDIRLTDYREVNEQFDHIISLGMFEHVGEQNYRTYMEVVSRCLKDDGIFLLHTIGGNTSVSSTDP